MKKWSKNEFITILKKWIYLTQLWKNEFFTIFRKFSGKCSVESENGRNFCQNQKFLWTPYFCDLTPSITFRTHFWHFLESLAVLTKIFLSTFLKITVWFGLFFNIFCNLTIFLKKKLSRNSCIFPQKRLFNYKTNVPRPKIT